MAPRWIQRCCCSIAIATLALCVFAGGDARARSWAETERMGLVGEPTGKPLFESPQSNPILLSPDGSTLYVANTINDSVALIDTASMQVLREIAVGLDPVALALRPDGKELWASNHISDSISVIDLDPQSVSYRQVVATIQDFDARGVTRLNEPVGIAFASNAKAYVALSMSNEIAIIDIAEPVEPAAVPGVSSLGALRRYTVRPDRILVRAQDPRAIAVHGDRLYVAAFESTNQTETSACPDRDGTFQCTIGRPRGGIQIAHIVRDPNAPDRDIFVYDTATDEEVAVVSHVGTLLYGIAIDSTGQVFVAHTEARNDVSGHPLRRLEDLQNRIYLNRVARIPCSAQACAFTPEAPDYVWDFESAPGTPVTPGKQMATPYGIAISNDDATLVVTAAASDRIATVDAKTGAMLGTAEVGASPVVINKW